MASKRYIVVFNHPRFGRSYYAGPDELATPAAWAANCVRYAPDDASRLDSRSRAQSWVDIAGARWGGEVVEAPARARRAAKR